MIVATATFVANDTCMKLAMAEAPPMQVLVRRGVAACLWCLPLLLLLGHGHAIARVFDRWVLLRCLCEIAAILAFVVALRSMAIADITAIAQIAPLLVLAGAALIWREPIGPARLVLVALGIAGALLVAQPGSGAASLLALLGFATAAGAAARDLVSRRVPRAIPALVVTFATLVTVMLAAAAVGLASEDWIAPTGRHIALMAAAGLFLMFGHLFVFLAYRLAPPRVVAPFFYCLTLWAAISGILVFGDIPNAPAIAGMALIVASGLAVLLFEGRSRRGEVEGVPAGR
jgi:drug/metabolite transporter (DMT)-like permease